jgi:hypothetical protein
MIIADDEIDMMFDRFEAALEDVALRICSQKSLPSWR